LHLYVADIAKNNPSAMKAEGCESPSFDALKSISEARDACLDSAKAMQGLDLMHTLQNLTLGTDPCAATSGHSERPMIPPATGVCLTGNCSDAFGGAAVVYQKLYSQRMDASISHYPDLASQKCGTLMTKLQGELTRLKDVYNGKRPIETLVNHGTAITGKSNPSQATGLTVFDAEQSQLPFVFQDPNHPEKNYIGVAVARASGEKPLQYAFEVPKSDAIRASMDRAFLRDFVNHRLEMLNASSGRGESGGSSDSEWNLALKRGDAIFEQVNRTSGVKLSNASGELALTGASQAVALKTPVNSSDSNSTASASVAPAAQGNTHASSTSTSAARASNSGRNRATESRSGSNGLTNLGSETGNRPFVYADPKTHQVYIGAAVPKASGGQPLTYAFEVSPKDAERAAKDPEFHRALINQKLAAANADTTYASKYAEGANAQAIEQGEKPTAGQAWKNALARGNELSKRVNLANAAPTPATATAPAPAAATAARSPASAASANAPGSAASAASASSAGGANARTAAAQTANTAASAASAATNSNAAAPPANPNDLKPLSGNNGVRLSDETTIGHGTVRYFIAKSPTSSQLYIGRIGRQEGPMTQIHYIPYEPRSGQSELPKNLKELQEAYTEAGKKTQPTSVSIQTRNPNRVYDSTKIRDALPK
jgi:hypothetical protein